MTKIQKEAPQNAYTMTAWRLKRRTVLRLEAWTNKLRRLTIGNPASQSARFGSGMDFEIWAAPKIILMSVFLARQKADSPNSQKKAKEQRNIAAAFLKVGLQGSGHKTYW